MPRNRSVEHWLLYLTNQLRAFHIHLRLCAKLKNAAPEVSPPVLLWELKIYIYMNKYCLSSSPAEPVMLVCLQQEGKQGQSWDMMLAPCTPTWTRLCFSAFHLSSFLQKPASGIWFFSLILLGCKCSKIKGSGYLSDEVIKQQAGLCVQLRNRRGPEGSWALEVKELSETQTVQESS